MCGLEMVAQTTKKRAGGEAKGGKAEDEDLWFWRDRIRNELIRTAQVWRQS